MKPDYSDILTHVSREPCWYDQNGCPRFTPFNYTLYSDPYAQQVFLLRIACQRCGRQFDVEVCTPWALEAPELVDDPRLLHYGDPPRHNDDSGHRCPGETMTCDHLAVLQAWEKRDLGWIRVPLMEGVIR